MLDSHSFPFIDGLSAFRTYLQGSTALSTGGTPGAPIRGGRDDDTLTGTDENDLILGRGGDDDILAGGGNDRVFGGRGDDVADGGTGNDSLFGGQGDDLLKGGAGFDLLDGGRGVDTAAYDGSITGFRYLPWFGDRGFVVNLATGEVDYLRRVEKLQFDDQTVWLDGRNNGPLGVDDTAATDEDTALAVSTVDLLANDYDFDGDSLTVSAVDATSANGIAVGFDGSTLSYDPAGAYDHLAEGETATDTITYTLSDGRGGTDTATLTVTIEGRNDAPVLTLPANATTPENTTGPVATASATDAEGDPLSFTLTGADAALFTISATGEIAFAAAPDFETPGDADGDNAYELTVTVEDGKGGSASDDLTVTVTDVAEASVVISEIMFNPASAEDDWEWVEIVNTGSSTLDLSGWVFDDINGLAQEGANIAGGSIAAGGSAILYNADDLSAADFEAAWGTGITLIGVTGWGAAALNNGGDTLGLWSSFAAYAGDHTTHANAAISVTYDGSLDDGAGSIYLTDLAADPNDFANWALSTVDGATPVNTGEQSRPEGGNSGNDVGSPGGAIPAGDVRINEFRPNPDGTDPATSTIELSGNPGGVFTGWILSIEGDGPSGAGFVDRAEQVSGTFDANGLLTVQIADLENPTFTLALVDTFTGDTGTRIDSDGDGVADDLSSLGTVLDAIGIPDAAEDEAYLYGAQLGGTDFAYTGDEPRLVFRDGTTGDLYAVNDPDNGAVYDTAGTVIDPAEFDIDPTAGSDTFGAQNPSRLGAPGPALVLNEIAVSTTGTDWEFAELLGTAGLSLDGIALIQVDGDGEVRSALDFSGLALGENGYALATSQSAEQVFGLTGDLQFSDNTFTNTASTFLLVEGYAGVAQFTDLDTDDDGVLDVTPFASVIDAVALTDTGSPLTYAGAPVVGPDGSFLPAGAVRVPEGTGDWQITDFGDSATYTPTAADAGAQLVINEIDSDTPGTDAAEFIELFDGGAGGTALDGLSLVLFNGNGDTAYDVIDLAGFSTDENGYFVVGSAEVADVDLVAFTTNGLQNGADAVALVQGDPAALSGIAAGDLDPASVIDAVVYGTADPDDAELLAAFGQAVQLDEDANGDKDNQSLSRVPNGEGDFTAQGPTPGAANDDGGPGPGTPTLISTIQGSGAASALVGQTVTVTAIVTGDFQDGDADTLRDLRGVFLTEEAADQDGDALTSEGLRVFEGTGAFLTDVNIGDRVTVTGTVSEFFGETQLTATSMEVVEAGAVADVNSLAVSLSLDAIDAVTTSQDGDYIPDLEAYEGMLVSFTDTLTVAEMFQMDRFNEIGLSANGRPQQYTQFTDPDAAGYDAYLQQTGSDRIVFDDGLNQQNAAILPEADLNNDGIFDTSDGFTMGDTITGLTGVLTYDWAGNSASGATWRVRSVDDGNVFADTGARQDTPPDVGGTVTVASFNVLNFFTTLVGEGTSGPGGLNPRGANTVEEYERQLDKLVTTLSQIDADLYGLVELENEFQTDQNGDGEVAIQSLVDAMNAEYGSIVWDYVDPGRPFVDTSDAISVGMLYRTDKLAYDPASVRILDDSQLDGLGFGALDDDGLGVFDGASTNRAPLAATFTDLTFGEDFTFAVTHMKSKGGSGTGDNADAGDGAGNFDALRTEGVTVLNAWLDSIADEDVLVVGDFNAYAQENPIDAMLAAGYTNLEQVFDPGSDSFVFDGYTGTLDYGFANGTLMDKVTGAAIWEINSPEPDAIDYNLDFGRDPAIFDGDTAWRASDHDPLLIGLDFVPDLELA